MIQRWYRALARTFSSGHNSSSPARRRSLTHLRLETIEERAVPSAVALDTVTAIPHAETQLTFHSHSAKQSTDDQTHAVEKDPATETSDGQQNTDQQGDAPDLLAGDAIFAGSESAVDTVPPSTHVLTSQRQSSAIEAEQNVGSIGQPKHEREVGRTADTNRFAAAESDVVAEKTTTSQPTPERTSAVERGTPPSPAESATSVKRDAGGGAQPFRGSQVSAQAVAQPSRDSSGWSDGAPNGRSRGALAGNAAVAGSQGSGTPADLPDGTLLQRFVANREQAAFTALVQRHASLVSGVCQRVLGDYHAAQDASQATFVVLARKAAMLDRNHPLGGWLYRVAYHIALRSRAVAARQRSVDSEAGDFKIAHETGDIADNLEEREFQQVVREELQSLPEKYRTPLTLCYFDGHSHADAAKSIGVPRGSMGKRIGEGLERLRERLLHRGFAL